MIMLFEIAGFLGFFFFGIYGIGFILSLFYRGHSLLAVGDPGFLGRGDPTVLCV